LGLVFGGPAALIVTSQRLIVMGIGGVSQLGRIADDEVHTFVLPWDLVTSIEMPAKKSLLDRVAGNRTIALFDAMTFIRLELTPQKRAEVAGAEVRVSDDDVMGLLTSAAVEHRITVSPAKEHARLQEILAGRLEIADGEKVAWLTSADTTDVPAHLVGRLVERK
jgi:hypothetical protein